MEVPGAYRIVLNTDDAEFGGQNRIDKSILHLTTPEGYDGRQNYIQVYSPSRTACIFAKND